MTKNRTNNYFVNRLLLTEIYYLLLSKVLLNRRYFKSVDFQLLYYIKIQLSLTKYKRSENLNISKVVCSWEMGSSFRNQLDWAEYPLRVYTTINFEVDFLSSFWIFIDNYFTFEIEGKRSDRNLILLSRIDRRKSYSVSWIK